MCHVLVIEDDFLIADHICQLMELAGATSIDQAATEGEAIAAARAHPPAVIVSDVRLAEGTGPCAVQAILAEHGEVPVIFVTGTPDACHPRTAPMIVLTKPIQDRLLMATFTELAPI
ncbi:response regulator [Sphingomonas abietis]|uniref:Response regulator n=1 Tax=Sphingomonas abietis TaxID=3012344 RepID=A0ABY7NWS4_9SPHN|nr:response regulator [Sphingomonas abietis]WBO23856.1 response regulator [Sphingomonas abietis]